ncbi:MAG TPA: AAA family ATPase, partial [Pyrinomonadaceae bacterium]|nr:AAA family ATPase [Pyrinomonadaceae bacterium]
MDNKPKLVIVTGRPGSGKTTLSKELGKLLYLPVISRDELKEGYVNTFNIEHDQLLEDTNKIVTEIFFENIELLLSLKVSVIAEAAFRDQVWRPKLARFNEDADVFVIICEVDAEVAAKRQLERGLIDPRREFFHGDKGVSHFRKTGLYLPPGEYEPPSSLLLPTIRVSTLSGYDPGLEQITEQIL